MRRASALLVTTGLLIATLSGCSAGQGSDCSATAKPGAASKLISASGQFGATPKVTFPTPLKTGTTQSSDLIKGTGVAVHEGQQVTLDISIFNGTTGELLQKAGYDKDGPVPVVLGSQIPPGLLKGLECATVGSRVAIAISPKDAAEGNTGTDSFVAVVDLHKSFLLKANGTPQPTSAGFPSVVLAPDGTPGITVPKINPPSQLRIEALKKGDGTTVKRGDKVVVHYTGVLWKERTVFDSSWSRHEPVTLVADDAASAQGGIVPGFADALLGQKVGSQVVAIIPPDKGYGAQGSGQVPANSTLVFVIDILGIL
ncbi:MAG: FKBP-type peptidyl-prolyl cis-trans isomerase [Microbacteriaceae bacterium]